MLRIPGFNYSQVFNLVPSSHPHVPYEPAFYSASGGAVKHIEEMHFQPQTSLPCTSELRGFAARGCGAGCLAR